MTVVEGSPCMAASTYAFTVSKPASFIKPELRMAPAPADPNNTSPQFVANGPNSLQLVAPAPNSPWVVTKVPNTPHVVAKVSNTPQVVAMAKGTVHGCSDGLALDVSADHMVSRYSACQLEMLLKLFHLHCSCEGVANNRNKTFCFTFIYTVLKS